MCSHHYDMMSDGRHACQTVAVEGYLVISTELEQHMSATVTVYSVEPLSPNCCYTCADFRANSDATTRAQWCPWVLPDAISGDSRTTRCSHYQPVNESHWGPRGAAIDLAIAYLRATGAVREAMNRSVAARITLILNDGLMAQQSAEQRVRQDVTDAALTIVQYSGRMCRGEYRVSLEVAAETGAQLIQAMIKLGATYDWWLEHAQERDAIHE